MSDLKIKDGTGRGYLAEVGKSGHLHVAAINESIQHEISLKEERAYQIIGTATLANATVVGLHVKNTSETHNLVVTYIRHQIIDPSGGTALPNASNYFRLALGRTLSSGGSTATAVNVHGGSAKTAQITGTMGAPTLTGTANEIDRWYTKAEADMNTFNKEGAVILPPNQTLELSYVGDHTSGTLYTRLSFIEKEIE